MSKIITRFPPEPNGYLHLGHLKAMMFDFNLHEGCECILRLDDTNPETEKQEYVDNIIKDVEWLGFKPCKITYTSDYFKDLYNFAIDLIKMNLAYVDFTPAKEMREMRHAGIESEYRNKSVEFNLEEFNNMANRVYKEGEAVLRLKIDMKNNNHTLRDPIAYRIKYAHHYRVKDVYCIWPSYDYSHGIVDALEKITHSYCTTEFMVRRDLYYWPVVKLGLVPATVVEFGRLNVEDNVLSKRKILDYIKTEKVSGFDDPRLLTITGLRRRGFTANILKSIVSRVSMERHDTILTKSWIDHHLRSILDKEAPRCFAVINPIKLIISDENNIVECEHLNHPINDMGKHKTILSKNLYIETSDFKEVDKKNYHGLAPNKTVRLRYAYFVKCVGFKESEITVEKTMPENSKKIKGILHWVSEEDSVEAIFELYDPLLKEGDYNKDSKIVRYGRVEKAVLEFSKDTTFQFERLGYFRIDRYEDEVPVFIRVINLMDKFK